VGERASRVRGRVCEWVLCVCFCVCVCGGGGLWWSRRFCRTVRALHCLTVCTRGTCGALQGTIPSPLPSPLCVWIMCVCVWMVSRTRERCPSPPDPPTKLRRLLRPLPPRPLILPLPQMLPLRPHVHLPRHLHPRRRMPLPLCPKAAALRAPGPAPRCQCLGCTWVLPAPGPPLPPPQPPLPWVVLLVKAGPPRPVGQRPPHLRLTAWRRPRRPLCPRPHPRPHPPLSPYQPLPAPRPAPPRPCQGEGRRVPRVRLCPLLPAAPRAARCSPRPRPRCPSLGSCVPPSPAMQGCTGTAHQAPPCLSASPPSRPC
jgi:hypothetical protein